MDLTGDTSRNRIIWNFVSIVMVHIDINPTQVIEVFNFIQGLKGLHSNCVVETPFIGVSCNQKMITRRHL